MRENDKEREEQIRVNEELVLYYRDLATSVNSLDGRKIITEIASQANDLNNYLSSVSLQPLAPPYYEYHKDDLQKMKATRAKIEALSLLLNTLNAEYLLNEANRASEKVKTLKAGEPLEPSYAMANPR